MKHILFTMALILLFSCQNNAQVNPKQQAVMNASPIAVPLQKGKAKAYFASGCFWCVEAIFESVKGVDESVSGYAGGHTKNPTYESNSYGRIKDHAEAVEITYDPSIVSFETLVDVYFASQNPTQMNGQGPDKGYQYRSIIFLPKQRPETYCRTKKSSTSELNK
jgi:peptide-methionine (S)-S-oxide reductase